MPGKRREASPDNSKMEVDQPDASPQKELPTKKAKGPTVDAPKKDVDIKIKNNYPNLYRDAVKHQEKKLALFQQVLDEENKYREIFAQDRESKLISDPYLMVVDAHANTDIFNYAKESDEEKKLPRIFETQQQRVPAATTGLCINDHKEFTRNFSIFMEDQLKFLNWDNVFIAGGSVLACLMPIPEGHNKNNRTRRNYYHKVAYKSSDVDLFIYGLDSEEAANKKIEEIYEAVCEAIPNPVIAFRSKNAITLVSQFPYRHIQIVLRLYKSPAEILMGFDVDCCSVGYDGKKVWVLPRAQRALTYRYNTVDMTRRSPSYEMRLAKYSSRGFSVVVPSFDRNRVDPQLFERRFDQLQGLARLLLLEKLETPEARFRYKEQQRLRKIRPQAQNRESFWTQLDPRLGNDEYSRERLEEQGGADASDYSTVFLPWGPGWTAERARKLMYTKDMILNSKWYDVKKKIHTHPCFFGTVSEVIHDCCGHCPEIPDDQFDPDAPYVSGKLTWVTVNPGSQARIGSFHPITEGDWTEAAYINTKAEKLFIAINGQDVKTVKACLQEGVDVDGRDSAGRTPLQLAAYTNSVEAAKILIEHGARISTKTYDGRTALHIAAAYGHSEIIKLIVKRGKELGTAEKKSDVEMKDKKPKSKKKKSEDSDEEEEDEDMDEEENEEDEENEENEENEDEDEFQGIKGIIEQKKKEKEAQLEALDPNLDDKSKQDVLEIDLEDWDNKFTPLHYAIYFGHVDAIEALIEGGAKVDKSVQIRNQEAYRDDKWVTITPISLALGSADYKAVIRLLVDNGCAIDQVDHKLENILHKAVRAKHMAAIKFLVEGKFKLNVNAFNKNLETPLHLAIEAGTVNVESELTEDESEEAKKKKEERKKSGDFITDKDFEVIKYLINKGKATVHFTEDDLPSQSTIQQQFPNFSSGGSKREQLRNNITQPIISAAKTGSIRLLELLIDEGAEVNWFDNSLNTPMDLVKEQLSNLEGEKRDTDNLKVLEARLKKVKKTSWEFEELSAVKGKIEADLEENLNWRYQHLTPAQKKAYAERKKELKSMVTKVEAFLTKKKAQPFHAVKLGTKDKGFSAQQKERKTHGDYKSHKTYYNHNDNEESKDEFSMKFKAVKEEQENYSYYNDNRGYHYSDEENEKYLQFFEACWNGDLATVEKLAVKPKVGSQVHACSQSKFSGRTPLHIAVEKKHAEIAKRLIEIAVAQYTPIPAPSKLDRDGAPAINNYELSNLMNDIRPGLFLDPKGMTLNQQYKPSDPNAPVIQLNSITSPSALLKHADKTGRTILHIVGLSDDVKLGQEIIDTIKSKKIKLVSTPGEEQKMFQQDVEKDLVKHLITLNSEIRESYNSTRRRRYRGGRSAHSGEFTPLQVAVAAGSTKVAELFIEHGGLAIKGSSGTVGEEEMYEGLNVGGKKSDWVLQHRANQNKPKKYVTLLHFAAAVGNEKSIDFLTQDAEKLLKQDKKPEDLDLLTTDEEERTPLHYAVHHNSEDGVKALLAAAKKQGILEKVVNAGTKNNVTPLHYAASLGYLNIIKLLVEAGADVNAQEKKTFFTPLFLSLEYPEVTKYLITKLDKKAVNAGTKKYNHTPLMYAAYKGYDKAVQLLLESDTVDSSLRDICGNSALYIAIISQQSKCVELLLNDKTDKALLTHENGIGYIPLDASMLKSLRDSPLVPPQEDTQKIRDLVTQMSKSRKLAKNEDILELTNIMIEQANKFSMRERRQEQHEAALCEIQGIKKPEDEEEEENKKHAIEVNDGSGMYIDDVSVNDTNLPLQLGIFTRSHDDDAMEVEESDEEEEEKPKKGAKKTSSKKEESEDEEEEEEEEKPKKKAPVKKSAPAKKTAKKEEESEDEEEEEEKPKKKAPVKKAAPAKKAAKKEESDDEEEEEEEEEKPKKKAAPKKAAPAKKAVKKEESDEEEEEEDDDDDTLKGKVVALTGTLSMKRDDIVKIIKKNGGEYSGTITKKTTHLIAADPDSGSAKLEKARKAGIKVVGESFLEKFM